ncbi:MAG: glucoamylase family protein [Nitrosomonas sp.]|nr:glucoamylase family protein [Nitrosomonas sp.]MDP1949753.1 glucoamylase family protein [Nitrosomonas sp.]
MKTLGLRWHTWISGKMRPREGKPPLRAELFSVEQLARHAKVLATHHQVVTRRGANRLLERLRQNEETLRAFNRASLAVHSDRHITPAAEWLLDNFYLIEEQIQMAWRHLPRGYSQELPCLLNSASAGLPRVYDIVSELISHVDAQIDTEPLNAFIAAYQTGAPLKLGELWAIPIMLRLGLIENLQRVATRLINARADRDLAVVWVDRLQNMAENNPSHLVIVVADMAKSDLPLSSSFVTEFCQCLSRQSPVLHLARNWLEQQLVEQGSSIEHLIQQESQSQAANRVSVSHSIASLRLLGAMDWKTFVESQSLVEELLRSDPAGVYSKMDFSTRDRYRHSVEAIAKYSQLSETEVARKAVQLAADSAHLKGTEDRTAHVGFYLIDNGQAMLEHMANVRWPGHSIIERSIRRFPLKFYVGGIVALTLLATFMLVLLAESQVVPGWKLIFLTLIGFLCASQLAVALMNWLSTRLVKPSLLPRLDYSSGIATECRTLVVVPTMLTGLAGIDHLIETLEIHYLANRDPHLHFALLTDFRDAVKQVLPEDHALLERVRAGVEMLNQKYSSTNQPLFFLFHRPRRWNAGEGVWMGYERKRGKLLELSALLRGGSRDCFSEIVGETAILSSVKYVITLDTDTQLPRGAARQLVGAMAHTLNRPVFDDVRGIVTTGYSILQPRVGVSLPSARRSWFVRIFAGDAGIDPYTREVSDVYQDVFQEGSFIGKGIYDVDAFLRALSGRFPENTILSHDLLEACYARSALVSDVIFFEEYPSRYNVDIDRRHRWIRGDWQIMQWLLPRIPDSATGHIANPLSALSQWKIFDNLRRSLVPIALVLLLPGSWLLFPELGGLGPLLVVAVIAFPGLLAAGNALRKSADLPWAMHLRGVIESGGRQLGQMFLTLAFLPYEAFISLDAIGRTLLRLLVTHKRRLEWKASSDAEFTACTDLASFYYKMWIAPVVALSSGLFLGLMQPTQLLVALPMLGLWLASPWIAWKISQPIEPAATNLTAEQLTFLRVTARRTWHFFDTFVSAQENWLPPDNFQANPTSVIATRTSPTNMGLALLANLAARDFGYLSAGRLMRRTKDMFATMHRLERHRGHFYNWYETRTLQPLLPLYVSSVDSGNLAGHLLTLAAGLRELADEPIYTPQIFAGLGDTVKILLDLVGENVALSQLDAKLANAPSTLRAGYALLQQTTNQVTRITASFAARENELKQWGQTLKRSCEEHLEEFHFLAPWLRMEDSVLCRQVDRVEKLLHIDQALTLRKVSNLAESFSALPDAGDDAEEFLHCLQEASEHALQRLVELEALAKQSDELAAMDFTFLFDPKRDLFSIGFNVAENRCDASFYDLLASEARLCSYVAIALGQVPQEHWFSMSRLLIAVRGEPILVSWSGSMFEYLMPLLVMPNYDNTLLDHSCQAAVQQQIEYGKLRGVAWGISESGYNQVDIQLSYQYRAFGVPGLGLKRGLADDLVIAPYASVMALMVAPQQACVNLQRLSREGRAGAYGFYEAVDYTPSRLPPNESSTTVLSFMAHHQGISLLALDNLMHDDPMQRRFMACPLLKAADLLLQERIPRTVASVFGEELKLENLRSLPGKDEAVMRVFTQPTAPVPQVHLLSNGRYHVVVSSAGGGYSRWGDLALTRWREDATRDCWGMFVYLRDVVTGEFWSSAYQPTLHATKGYEAIFTQSRAEFRQHHADLEIHTEISVSPEDDVELRRITLINRSSVARNIELTSYAEVVLATPATDAAHPAFSNLFVQTEFAQESSAILCTRRARSQDEVPPWLLHVMRGQGGEQGIISCETDRARFIGRGRNLSNPAAMQHISSLSNTVGSVLDPIISLRRTVTVQPHETAIVDLVLGVTESRETALAQVEKYQSARMADRTFDLAWTHGQVTLHHINASELEAQLYTRLAGALIYADPARRASPAALRNNRRGQNGLWGYGISGDVPLVLLRISDTKKIELAQQLIKAHSYWRLKGLTVDLVILSEDVSVYRQSLHDQIISMISFGIEAQMLDRPGGIFVRRLEQVPNDDLVLLQSVARLVMDDERGTFTEQVRHRAVLEPSVPVLIPTHSGSAEIPVQLPQRELTFSNGLGGFTRDGHEYVITLQSGQVTPAPWVNVLANPYFGTVISESGAAYTWVENSHEFRLTPWSNDPVQDTSGEAIYIRDEHTGQFWSPTPSPACGTTPYVIRHGFGYSVFEHTENGIASELWVYVAVDAPVKFSVLKLRNVSGRPRRVSATAYCEWVLGDLRHNWLLHVQTEMDLKTGALLAHNHYNTDYSGRIAFLDVNDATRTLTGDRKEFIGRNGSLARPAALKRKRLSGKVGVGLDPCGAVQVAFDLLNGEERETSFRLGVGRNPTEVHGLIQRFRRMDASRTALEGVWDYWNRTLGAVNVDTPDPAVNVMANGWLLYQTLSCRLWGRTGFYQSGGAYGFRDQLQDVMALVHAEPALTREHLLRAATHQFREGDVQHWWHPPAGRGVRTNFSDDYLWLPYATCRYVTCVADTGVLDEKIPFLEARPVKVDEEAYYDLPNRSEESDTLYQHCVRAIKRGLNFGAHGLPLMGCGDWNDGMNRVGNEGRGESVWLAFFLYDVLTQFAALARARLDLNFADHCTTQARQLQLNIEQHGWDGAWYRRAYFDNGEPLGSQTNPECQIDSLPQSWAVLSGGGDPLRSRQAMQSVDLRLVRREARLIQLFDPPFDKSKLNPGYIKGYIPGVRENGGQYTHGAIWTAMAFALMGEHDHAWELFSLLNPIHHGATAEQIATYKVEPYVVAADVYGVAPHTGRGGWTWYTGSAGWMYRLLIETLLGVNLEGDQLHLTPRMPKSWTTYKIHYRYRQTVYHITITRLDADANNGNQLFLDGKELAARAVPLLDDRHEHTVELKIRQPMKNIASELIAEPIKN